VYTYATRVEDEPWNLPPYKLTFAARHNLRDKLVLKAEAMFLGRRTAYRAPEASTDSSVVAVSTRTQLDGFLDLYLGAEYRYTKRLSMFLDISNLSASKYERWYRHPTQRGLIMLGATYAF
jgi:outer membrane receptor for ferrienterochelin and colicin